MSRSEIDDMSFQNYLRLFIQDDRRHKERDFIYIVLVWFIVFYDTFNNISVISWQSVLLVEETGVPGENH
jgi:hypothetical protein